jgi:pre-mRNA branch site protein p14
MLWKVPTDTRSSYNVTPEELFELFGKFGPIRYVPHPRVLHISLVATHTDSPNSQVRQGIANATKGTAFVVYEDVMDAKQACDKLNGFNFQNRYLVGMVSYYLPCTDLLISFTVLYHQPEKMTKSSTEDLEARQANLEVLKQQHGIE